MKKEKKKLSEYLPDTDRIVLNGWDMKVLNLFVLITGFVNIMVITSMLSDSKYHFSNYAKLGLIAACLIMALIICYVALRKAGIFELIGNIIIKIKEKKAKK